MSVIQTATIDLNPQQIEAALFALKPTFQRVCIFADETRLDKTIEAGLVLDQKQNIDKRHALIIVSYNFAKDKADFIKEVKFDIVIIYETQRLRPVYKEDK